jgi:hypothetical protein
MLSCLLIMPMISFGVSQSFILKLFLVTLYHKVDFLSGVVAFILNLLLKLTPLVGFYVVSTIVLLGESSLKLGLVINNRLNFSLGRSAGRRQRVLVKQVFLDLLIYVLLLQDIVDTWFDDLELVFLVDLLFYAF